MTVENQHLDALQDIRKMMQRSSRFISLSGLSGISAGIWALIGAYMAGRRLELYYIDYNSNGYINTTFGQLKNSLMIIAAGVLFMALVSAFYFTWRRAGRDKVSLWDYSSKMLMINMLIPLVSGGLFILAMLQYNEWRFVAPASLLFYGLALVNASKYTLGEIRYLGICQIILGLLNTQFLKYGLHFWTVGFGVLHIVYGFAMWWKYERK